MAFSPPRSTLFPYTTLSRSLYACPAGIRLTEYTVLCEDAVVGFEGGGDHTVHGKSLEDGGAGGGADLTGLFGMVEELADGVGDGGLVVLDEEAVFAVADDLSQPADIAGDHGHGRRHGQQDAGAEPLARGDIDQDFRGGDLLFEVGDHLESHAGEECGILFQAEHLVAVRDVEQGHAVVDDADFIFGDAALDQHILDELRDCEVAPRSAVLPAGAHRKRPAPGNHERTSAQESAEGVAARVVGVDERVAAQAGQGAGDAPGLHAPAQAAGGGVERGTLARQEGGLHAGGGQAFDEPQDLPLAAAHLSPGIEVEDAHQLMFLALEYFRKV